MELDATNTLADAVDARPELARELERLGLDYCCAGSRTIAEACASIGVDPQSVIASMREGSAGGAGEWTTMSADALVDHLEATHHRYLWDELPRVHALMDKVVSVHGERHPELVGIARCFTQVRADLEPHLMKEERVLFPMIRALPERTELPSFHRGSLQDPISVMLREHDAVGALLAELRRLTGGYTTPPDGCASYGACFSALQEIEADTHLHIHKENNVLFPLVVRLEAEHAAGERR